ncbi:hypothetical protein FB451DRAFT_1047293, partial [Mycena latifolia]
CAPSDSVVEPIATQAPMGVVLAMESSSRAANCTITEGSRRRQLRNRVALMNLLSTLPVHRKEFDRNAKCEFGKALTLLNACALCRCSSCAGVRQRQTHRDNQKRMMAKKLCKSKPQGRHPCANQSPSSRVPKPSINLDLSCSVEREKVGLRRSNSSGPSQVTLRGFIPKFAVGCGRTGTDRQSCYVHGRPYNLCKVFSAISLQLTLDFLWTGRHAAQDSGGCGAHGRGTRRCRGRALSTRRISARCRFWGSSTWGSSSRGG